MDPVIFTVWTLVCFFPQWLNAKRPASEGQEEVISHGPVIWFLQWVLQNSFTFVGELTGIYDEATVAAVKLLQARLGFKGEDVDGDFGQSTREALARKFGIDVQALTFDLMSQAKNQVTMLQWVLKINLGLKCELTGVMDEATVTALKKLQVEKLEIPETGEFDETTRLALADKFHIDFMWVPPADKLVLPTTAVQPDGKVVEWQPEVAAA